MLTIDTDLITLGASSYPTKNISKIGVKELHKTHTKEPNKLLAIFAGLLWLILGFFLVIVVPLYYGSHRGSSGTMLLILFVGGVAITVLLLKLLNKIKIINPQVKHWTEYAIEITTNSGSSNLISSPNREFINQVHQHMLKALTSNSAVSYTVNIEKMAIENNVDNSTTHNGDIINNYDFSINYSQYPNLDDISQKFLETKFEDALKTMMQEALRQNNEPLQNEIKSLIQAINQPEPDPKKLDTAVKRVEKVSSIYDVGKNCLEVVLLGVGMISAATSLIG